MKAEPEFSTDTDSTINLHVSQQDIIVSWTFNLFHISVFFIYLKTFRRPGLMKNYSEHKPGGQINHEK